MATKTRTSRGRRRAPPRPTARPGTKRSTPQIAPQSPPEDRLTLTAPELARLLGVDRKTVYEGAASGQIPSIRVGRRLLFPRAAIDAWLSAARPRRATVPAPTRSLPRKEVTKQ